MPPRLFNESGMYQQFFGLRERPFDLVPNPKFLYLTRGKREAASNLRYGLSTPRGLTLLIGEAGTGKTTILQAVLADIDQLTVECVLISNPALTRNEFYEALAEGFGLGLEAARSKTKFLSEFRAHLEARHGAGLLTALVIDESQSLSFELLEEIRLLSNIETPTSKLLNVILAGQPELALRLNDPELRQLKQRISLRCELTPFDFSDTAAYVAGRLRIAGGEPAAIFSREAILAIHEASSGVPRTINVVCDNALIGAYAAQLKPVLRSIVEEVVRDFDLTTGLRRSPAPVASEAAPVREPEPATPSVEPVPAEVTPRTKRFSFF
jgi:general secretion pathway protein A